MIKKISRKNDIIARFQAIQAKLVWTIHFQEKEKKINSNVNKKQQRQKEILRLKE